MSVYGGLQLPQISEEQLDEKKERRQILNYLAMLDEKLRYMFQNIDIDENLSEESKARFFQYGEDLRNLITDTDGNFSLIEQTIDHIRMAVGDNEGNIASLQIQADSIQTRVSNAEGDISTLTQTADSIQTRVASAEGSISSLTQTAEGIQTRVSNAEGSISTLTQTATEIAAVVSDPDTGLSAVQQTADKINWIVASGKNASSMTLTDDFLEIVADHVVVRADVELFGFMTVWRTDDLAKEGGYIGYSTGDDGVNAATSGIAVSSTDLDHYLIATNSGIRMTAEENAVVVMDDQITATEEISISSDRRVKENISYDMEKYADFFRRLQPGCYQYKNGKSGRLHLGFIAQDVERAIAQSGITTKDFAGLVQLSGENPLVGEYADQYYLRYENFIPLNTYMIQKLLERVEELEQKVAALEQKA